MMISILTWLLLFELFGLAAYPLLRRALPGGIESAFAASKLAGFVFFGVFAWCANWFFHLSLTAPALCGLLGGLMAAAWLIQSRCGGVSGLGSELRTVGRVEVLYLAVFLLSLLLRSMQPEIFWGEKPMDFTLLNYFIRVDELPPQEPWAAGLTLNYYYLGFLLFSLVHKVTAVDSAVGFNLAVASVGALTASTTIAVLIEAGVRKGTALVGALAITLLSNWEVLRLWWIVGQRAGFDLFWASSRVFTSPAFSEYPLWSILFADLHAHVMAIPVAVLCLACALAAIRYVKDGGSVALPVVHGGLLGALYGINAWDLLSQSALLLALQGMAAVLFSSAPISTRLGRVAEYLLTVGATAAIFVIPFRFSMGPGPELHYGWVLGEFNSTGHIVRYLGQWIVPIGVVLGALVLQLSRRAEIHFATLAAALVAGAVPLVLGQIVAPQLHGESPPWALLCVLSAGLFCATIAAASRGLSSTQRVGVVLFAGALVMITAVELVFVMDRMNTIFKFYIPIWFLCGVSFFALLPELGERCGCIGRSALGVCVGGSLLVAAAGSIINIWGMLVFHRVESGPRPTLNGMAYHAAQNPDQNYLLQWMRRSITGQPTIIEAFGNSYGPFTRIAMNTGLPTVLGWEYHVMQRGVSEAEISARKAAIREFYSTSDIKRAAQILDRYKIAYVVVGQVEREAYRNGTYSPAGLLKFAKQPTFATVFQSGGEVLYATRYAPARSLISATQGE